LLFSAVTDRFGRATRDIDVSAHIENNANTYRSMIHEAATLPVPDDGVVFDPASINVNPIIEHRGLRATIRGLLGVARLYVQIDAGFGDPVMLPEQRFAYPSLLDDVEAPIVRAYSIESVIAEKFEAIASLGTSNTRYKDYDDIWQLAATRSFRATALFAALSMTYAARQTPLGATALALAANQATLARETGWSSYRKRAQARHALPTLALTLDRLRSFWIGISDYANDGLERVWEGVEWTR
jgi:Nucleotidyl transferase AbiEii toxin, Type IV TA system